MALRPITLFLCLAALVALGVALVPLGLPSATVSGADGFEARVRAYLLRHPEVIYESVSILQRREAAKKSEGQRRAVTAARDQLLASPLLPVAGNPAGDVTMVEFFDYRCPYCRQAVAQIKQALGEDANLRLVFKEFPVLGRDSVIASRLAVAASFQGKYLEIHDALMAQPGELTEAAALGVASRLGLDMAKLRADMASARVTQEIEASVALARRLGVSGTPSFVIGEEVFGGYIPAAEIKAAVGRARDRARR